MNEIMAHRLTKRVQGYGIPRHMAKDIAVTALEASRGKDVDMYLYYAIDLAYGLGFSKRFAK